MGPTSSARRQKYFEAGEMPMIKLQNGREVNVRYIETYPASLGFVDFDYTQEELHILVAENLKQQMKGRVVGQNMDSYDEFFGNYIIDINGKVSNRLASFKLQNDGLFYFIELLLIS